MDKLEEMRNNKDIAAAFKWLFIGLLCCFFVSYITSMNETIFNLVFLAFGGKAYFVYLILELVLCFVLALALPKMKPITAAICYILYTAVTGLSLTGIFLVYTRSSIAFVFLVTAIVFGLFAVIGYTTKVDLSKFGIYLLVALIAIILLSIVNIFLMNNTLDLVLCIVTIIVFCGYVAFDINRLTKMDCYFPNKGIYFAFQLFLDFINIFIKLLRLLGKRND